MDTTVYNDIREGVLFGLGKIPVVGGLVDALVGALWPEKSESIWDQIQGDVQSLVNQSLSTEVNSDAQGAMQGMQKAFYLYTQDFNTWSNNKTGTTDMLTSWGNANAVFTGGSFKFQESGYEVLLLPLFVQMANLQLALLRDRVANGVTWGRSAAEHANDSNDMFTQISIYLSWVGKWVIAGNPNSVAPTYPYTTNTHWYLPWWAGQNAWRRQMILTVLDFAALWPYFHPDAYPNPVSVVLQREIYSDPHGQSDQSGDDYEEHLTVTTPGAAREQVVYPVLFDPYDPLPFAYSPVSRIQSWTWSDGIIPRLASVEFTFADGSTLTSGLPGAPFNAGSDSNTIPAGSSVTSVNSYAFISDAGYYHQQTTDQGSPYNQVYLHRFNCSGPGASFTVGPTQSSPADYGATFSYAQHELSSMYMLGLSRTGANGSDQGVAGAIYGFKFAGVGTVYPFANMGIGATSAGFYVATVSPDQSGLATLWSFDTKFGFKGSTQLTHSGAAKVTADLCMSPPTTTPDVPRLGVVVFPASELAVSVVYQNVNGWFTNVVVGLPGTVGTLGNTDAASEPARASLDSDHHLTMYQTTGTSPGTMFVQTGASGPGSLCQLQSKGRPALIAANGSYYFAGQASDGSFNLMIASSTDGSFSGGAKACAGYSLQGTPALAYVNGNFIVAFRANDGSNQLLIGVSPTWGFSAPPAPCAGIRLHGSPSMTVVGNTAYLVYQPCENAGDAYPFRVISTTDGLNWYNAINPGSGRAAYVPSQDEINGLSGS